MYILWQIITTFFKLTCKTLVFTRNFFINVILFFLILFFINIYIHIKKNNYSQEISNNQPRALKIDIIGSIVDKTINNNISKISRQFLKNHAGDLYENSLFSIVSAIRYAQFDKNILGIVLDLKNFTGADQVSMDYIGKVLNEFKSSGKPIYAINDNYTQVQYYLSSFANIIYIAPQGKIDLNGFSFNNLYYKDLLDKLNITTNIFRVGTYKSAVEPFLRNDMSYESREVDSRWINHLWKNYLNTIAKNRKIKNIKTIFPDIKEQIKDLIQLNGDTAKYAKEKKLVDYIDSHINIEFTLNKFFGFNKNKNTYNNISIYDYLSFVQNNNIDKTKNNKISLVIVNGPIIDGEDFPGYSGSDSIVKEIRTARLNNNIKSMVLRINSPGGSLSASEQIREELYDFKKSGKPIVVSMGSTAASGGYWIATPASYIIADTNTLTGSIGVFGIFNTIEKLINKIGVYSDGISTSPLSNTMSTKEITPELKQIMQISIDSGYKRFLELVSLSRKKSLKQIEKISQGIVWTGHDAKINGLIDELGDFDDAVNKAVQLSNLKDYQLYTWQEEPTLIENIINNTFVYKNILLNNFFFNSHNIQSKVLNHYINYLKYEPTIFFQDPKNRYVMCLKCYSFKI